MSKPKQDQQKTGDNYKKLKAKELNLLLAKAVAGNDANLVRQLIETKVNINNTTGSQYGYTPLYEACYNKNFEIAKYLVEAGADVNKKGKNGKTPLLTACDAYDSPPIDKLVGLLLQHGANPNLHKKTDDSPLCYAAMYNQQGAVELLVKHGANINHKGGYKRTPLIYAASSASSPEMVQFLIENGADVKAQNEAGENALFEHITCDKTNLKVAEILLDSGIKVNSKSKHYGTLLHWAAFCGRTEIVELLVKRGADVNVKGNMGETPIQKAMSQHKLETAKVLFRLGANPLTSGIMGFSLMEFAIDKGDEAFVKEIVDKIKESSRTGLNAMATAARKGDLAMLKLLIKAGFDVNDRESWGSESPLIKAAYYGKLKAVEFLLENGADVKHTDYRGNTALLNAAYNGHTKVAAVLLKAGSQINERNNLNWNSLMQACVEGHFETAKFLLEKGSPLDEIDKEKGATVLTLAKYSGSKKLIELLESYGAKERSIKFRKKGQPYFSLFECEICQYLPDNKDLARTEYPEKFEGLELVFSELTHSDRYCDDTRKIMKCVNCNTFYHQYHSIDTEDAFIGGPSISQDFQRINLTWLKDVLKTLGKKNELDELNERYHSLVKECLDKLNNTPEKIIDYHRRFVIETIEDYFIKKEDWEGLKQNLLGHKNPNIVLETVKDLIVMYGERCWKGNFPRFTSYRSIKEEYQKSVKLFLNKHLNEIRQCIKPFENHKDERIQEQYKSVLKSAKFYKIFT